MVTQVAVLDGVKPVGFQTPISLKVDRGSMGLARVFGRAICECEGRFGEDEEHHLCCALCDLQLVQTSDGYWRGANRLECPQCGSFIVTLPGG